jgi:hypothetical protein
MGAPEAHFIESTDMQATADWYAILGGLACGYDSCKFPRLGATIFTGGRQLIRARTRTVARK